MVILAFATVYLVWGSTYFFIQKAVQHIPAFIMGAMRFLTAGLLMLTWCIIKKEKVWKNGCLDNDPRPPITSGNPPAAVTIGAWHGPSLFSMRPSTGLCTARGRVVLPGRCR